MTHENPTRDEFNALEARVDSLESRLDALEGSEEPTPEPEPEPEPTPSGLTALEQAVLDRVNVERRNAGVQEVSSDLELLEIARAHSRNMQEQDTLSHNLDGKGGGDRLDDANVEHTGWAENIAYGYQSADSVMNAWMGSTGHRENILNPSYSRLGIGTVETGSKAPWYTQLFIATADSPAPDPEPEPEPTPDPTPSKTLFGATVGWISGKTQNEATQEFIDFTGRPLPVRRCFDAPRNTSSGIPASISSSNLRNDNGVRAQVWSFKPSSNVSQSDVEALFDSIPDRSQVYVTPYHEPRDNMSASEYLRRYRIVRAAYDAVGGFAGMGPILTNWGTYASNGLEYVDSTGVDFLAIDPYGDSVREDNLHLPITESASVAIDFCNNRGIPLNIGEFGVDTSLASDSAHQAWMESFADLPNVVQVDWMCYWHDSVSGLDTRLNSTSVQWYRYLYDHFNASS